VADKRLLWMGTARADLREFPAAARRLAGFQLRRVQQGLDPNIIHAFAKKARKTSRHDLEIGRERFRVLIATRKQQYAKEQPR